MKCPYCGYEDSEYDDEKHELIKGEDGDFWALPAKMERHRDWRNERVELLACPVCRKVFIAE